MATEQLMKEIFEAGKAAGFGDMEVYIDNSKSFETMCFEGEITKYALSEEAGLAFRGIYSNGKMGYAYTELMAATAIPQLIENAKSNAEVVETEEEVFIYEPKGEYKQLSLYNPAYEEVTNEQKLDFILEAERHAKSLDERVFRTAYNLFMEGASDVQIRNTKGLDVSQKNNYAVAYFMVMVKDGGDQKTAAKYIMGNDFKVFDPKKLAEQAVEEALGKLGASPVASKAYPIILQNKTAADLIKVFSPNFSAERVQKDLSQLKGKLGETVANPIVTVLDDPHLENGIESRSFDGEGVATKPNALVEEGVLKTFMHNLKTANVDGVEPTGNGVKASFKSSVGIAPSNFYVKPGADSFETMIGRIENGLYITELQGLHSGANPVSGDFSLQANGFLIKNGKIDRGVNQITVAGNFYTLLTDIVNIGDDLKFGLPGGGSVYGAPTLHIRELVVSGE